MKYLVWDTEALFPKEPRMSWPEYRRLAGISVAATIDQDGIPAFYTPQDNDRHNIEALAEALETAEKIVSYNGNGYDTLVLGHILGRPLEPRHHIDLYAEIRRELNEEWWPKGSWKLGRVAYDTLGGLTKSGEGAMAPSLWQGGHIGELMTYVYRDVHICRLLFEHILREEWVLKPNGEKLPVYLDL